jgi:hypothetical protein
MSTFRFVWHPARRTTVPSTVASMHLPLGLSQVYLTSRGFTP